MAYNNLYHEVANPYSKRTASTIDALYFRLILMDICRMTWLLRTSLHTDSLAMSR
jgi:hypothetical protein